MELQHFLSILSTDQNVRNQSISAIQAAESDPNFVNFVINSICSEQAISNPVLQKSLLIVLDDISKNHINNMIKIASEDQKFIQRLINLLFSINFENRVFIEDCIIKISLTDQKEFSSIIPSILQTINETCNIDHIYTVLSLALKWIESSSDETFMSDIGIVLAPILNKVVSATHERNTFLTIGLIASMMKELLTRRNLILDSNFDNIIQAFDSFLLIDSNDEYVFKMKTEILNMLIKLVDSVFDKWKSIEEIGKWVDHFSQDLLPQIVTNTLQMYQLPMNEQLFGSLFHLYYTYLNFGILIENLLTDDFFQNIVIKAARLTPTDLQDFEINELVYISFCNEHNSSEFFSARICASSFLSIILKEYKNIFDPLPILIQQTSDPIDFEARIYLLQRYTIDSDLPDDVFEMFFNLLTQEQPLYIVSSLIHLITIPMQKNDAVVGITVAEHFILNAENRIIQYAAVCLMIQCLTDFDDRLDELNGIVEVNTDQLFPALLKLSGTIFLPEPIILMEKIFQIGGNAFLNIVSELVKSFFEIWRSNEELSEDSPQLTMGPSLMNSATTVLEMVEADSPLILSLAPTVLGEIAKDIIDFPDNPSFSEQIRVAAVFSHKITQPIKEQLLFVQGLLQMDVDPLTMYNIVALLGPLILEKNHTLQKMELTDLILNLCQNILEPEQDHETLGYCLVLASCLIQAEGEKYFSFVETASKILISEPDASVLIGCLYIFASSFYINSEKTATLIPEEVIKLVCEMLKLGINASYREVKLAVYVLSWFGKLGYREAFEIVSNLFAFLLEVKEINDSIPYGPDTLTKLERLHRNEELLSFAPLVIMPVDEIDEMKFYLESDENCILNI